MASVFNPTDIMLASIANFTSSPEIALLEHLVSDPVWPNHPDAAMLLDIVYTNVTALDLFTTKLAKVAADLAAKELAPEFWYRAGPTFDTDVTVAIKNCVKSAYGQNPQEADIEPAYFAVLIRGGKRNNIIASSLVNFHPWPDNQFKTNMEAVQKNWQQKKVATALFTFIEVVAEYLMNTDDFVRLNLGDGRISMLESLKDHAKWGPLMGSLGVALCLMLESCVDYKAPKWQRVMMDKTMGFEYEGRKGGDLVFSKEIHRLPTLSGLY